MAWVRIHDGAMSHPKILSLSAPAFRLWVAGLSYCQQHLTDGRIPAVALGVLLGTKADAAKLVAAGLWHRHGDTYEVHDYLAWNDSRDQVTKKRASLKERVTRYRRVTERVSNASTTSGVVITTAPDHQEAEGVQGESAARPSPPPSSAPAPRRGGQQFGRLFVHRWQVEHFVNALGAHAADFDLDQWLLDVSERSESLVLAGADRWTWLQAQFAAEVARRGLPVATAPSAPPKAPPGPSAGAWEPFVCPHEPACSGRSQCSLRSRLDAARAEAAAAKEDAHVSA